jgi:hypothetical protein
VEDVRGIAAWVQASWRYCSHQSTPKEIATSVSITLKSADRKTHIRFNNVKEGWLRVEMPKPRGPKPDDAQQ